MSVHLHPPGPHAVTARELATLRARLATAEATLRAIQSGDVDTVVVAGQQGPQVFTLAGAEHPYRLLIESMNEGALTLTPDKTILYANACFARMVQCPLEQVTGGSLRRFLSLADRAFLLPLLVHADPAGAKIQVTLQATAGAPLPVQLSIRLLAPKGDQQAIIGVVVTDLTEARRTEDMLRALTHRVVQAQEAERSRVALDLHDGITQLLCSIVIQSQLLLDRRAAGTGATPGAAMKLRQLASQAAEEVERIAQHLRPGVLEHLGLIAAVHETSTAFAQRTGLSIKVACVPLPARLAGETELALYRILQEALHNVEKHAHARHVSVCLLTPGPTVQLVISDDGIGFDPALPPARSQGRGGMGLLGMRERAAYVGGTLQVATSSRTGTEIMVCMPLLPAPAASPPATGTLLPPRAA